MTSSCDKPATQTCTTSAKANVSLCTHLLLAVLSMVLFALSFPKPGWWALIFFALVPMGWLALAGTCARRLCWTTYLMSYVGWLVLMRWMIPVTFGGWWAMCLYLALHVPAALLVFRLLVKYVHLPATIALPMAWVSFEWLRGHFPSGGFGWYVLGHALAPWQASDHEPIIAQLASIFGELGVSFLIAMTSGWVVDLLGYSCGSGRGKLEIQEAFSTQRAQSSQNQSLQTHSNEYSCCSVTSVISVLKYSMKSWQTWLCTLLLFISWGLTGWYGWGRTNWYMSEFYTWPSATVAVVQTNLPQYNKESPTTKRLQEEWTELLTMTRQAALSEGDAGKSLSLVMWTETIVPRPLDEKSLRYLQGDAEGLPGSGYYHEQIAALSRELGVNLLVGTPWWNWEAFKGDDGLEYVRPGGAYNVAVLYRESGQRDPVHYAKMHRVPFGEYVPWVEDWPWLKRMFIRYLTPYEFDYTLQPGKLPVVFEAESGQVRGKESGRVVEWSSGRVKEKESGQVAKWPSGQVKEVDRRATLRFVTPICFEDAVPRVCRKLVYDGQGNKRADLIANITNDGWFAGTHQPWQHLQIATLRSIELGVPSARAVNTGISGFVNSVGRIEKQVTVDGQTQDVAGTAMHTLAMNPHGTFFGRWGDWPVRIMVVLTLVLPTIGALMSRLKRKSSGRVDK